MKPAIGDHSTFHDPINNRTSVTYYGPDGPKRFTGTDDQARVWLDAHKRGVQVALPPAADAGVKHDDGKSRMDLLSPVWLEGVGQVLSFGAKKYGDHNWRRGLTLCRLLAAALRHTFKFLAGENLDPESGLPHLHHASACLMMASEMWATRPDMDDRWKGNSNEIS
jgi:hypothetical protein